MTQSKGYDQRDAFTVACPTCRAAPGEPCVIRRREQPGRIAHLARQDRHARQLRQLHRKDTSCPA